MRCFENHHYMMRVQEKKKSEGKSLVSTTKTKAKSKKKSKEKYSSYIFKVLQQRHPDVTLTNQSLEVMNKFIMDVFNRVANEASNLAKANDNDLVTSCEIQEAVNLLLPGELAKRAKDKAEKALSEHHDEES